MFQINPASNQPLNSSNMNIAAIMAGQCCFKPLTSSDCSPSRMIFRSTVIWSFLDWWSPLPLLFLPAKIDPPISEAGEGLTPQIKVAISKPWLILPSVREQLTSQDSLSTRLIRKPEQHRPQKRPSKTQSSQPGTLKNNPNLRDTPLLPP